jgi:uncharacterized protein DUF4136
VVRAVDEVLGARGYRPSPDRRDFVIGWDAAIEGRRQVTTLNITTPPPGSIGGGRLRSGSPLGQTIKVEREFEEGTLILDITDARTGRPVWRGWAQAEVKTGVAPAERERRIQEAVRRILERFPPKP